MNAIADTLRLARAWKDVGLPEHQAEGMVEALKEELNQGVATKHDIGELRSDMAAEFKAVRNDMAAEFKAVRNEMAAEFQAVRAELSADIKALRAETKTDIASLEARLYRAMAMQGIAIVAAAVSLMKLLP